MKLSTDARVLLLLCSSLGLREGAALEPLTLRAWNPLARRIKRPGVLLEWPAEELCARLDLALAEAERLAALLAREALLDSALERLEEQSIWAVTRADVAYPARLRERLGDAAPPVLFGAGERELLDSPALAVVGSRDVDAAGEACAGFAGEGAARGGLVLVSGGARGVDALAMGAALAAGGRAAGVLADSLARAVRSAEARGPLAEGALVLFTPYHPDAGFSVGAAMGRNRLIYTLADYALVVSSAAGTGGTWAGAIEALKARWAPVFVRAGSDVPAGNCELLGRGALPFPWPFPGDPKTLDAWLAEHAGGGEPPLRQGRLF